MTGLQVLENRLDDMKAVMMNCLESDNFKDAEIISHRITNLSNEIKKLKE